MIFDLRTIGLVSGVVPIALGLVMAVYWRTRRVYPGFGRWVVSNILLGTGFFLVDLRGIIPDFFSIIVGNILLIYSLVLICQGLQLFFALPRFDRWTYGAFGLYVVLQAYFTYVSPAVNARIVLASSASVYFHLLGVFILLRYAPAVLRQASRCSATVFTVSTLLSLVRGGYALMTDRPVDMLADQFTFWFALIFLILVIGWTYCFFILNSARLELELEDARRDLVQIAGTDSLTGISNHRHFFEHAEIEFQRARRNASGLAVILMDADHFKRINDKYGHDMGDITLQFIAHKLQSEVRPFDLVARFGGDEFVVMLPGVNKRQAGSIAERLHAAIREETVVSGPVSIRVIMSMGVSLLREGDADIRPILKRADTAMYRAKKLVRKQIVVD